MHNCSIRVNDLRGYLVICDWQDHIKFALEAAITEDRGTNELILDLSKLNIQIKIAYLMSKSSLDTYPCFNCLDKLSGLFKSEHIVYL